MIIDEHVYTIQEDENSKLWDLRTTGELTIPFRIGQLTDDCSLINSYKYLYGLTVDTVTWDNTFWDTWYEKQKTAHNSFLLVDTNLEPLFCYEVLKTYGIGFILSDWIKVDSNGKLKVHFEPSYVKNWLPASAPTTVIDSYTVYSIGQIKYGTTNTQIPELNQYYKEDPSSDAITYSKINGESWVKENFWGYRNATDKDNRFTNLISDEDYRKVMLGRQYMGAEMYAFNPTEGQITSPFKVTAEVGSDNINFITFYPMTEMGARELLFYRVQAPTSVIDSISSDTTLHKYNLEMCLWQEDILYWIYGNAAATPNSYNAINQNTRYVDNECIAQVTDSNGETPIKRELKYTKFSVNMEDVGPTTPIDGSGKSSYNTFQRYSFLTNILQETHTVGTTPTPEELLEEELEENPLKYQTPSEYYSKNVTTNSKANIEDAFNDLVGDDRNWFWLDTIKNWCIYVLYESRLELMCWNGIDGWDRVYDIMVMKNSVNLYSLAQKYFYSQYFFEEGVAFPNDRWGCFVPIRYPNGVVGQVYYRSLILKQDTTTKNYNNKFQNLHDTKIYQTGERNTYSNAGIGVAGRSTNGGHPIHVDENTRAVFGVPTQYCPVVLKNANGLMSIMYCFYLPTNGYGATDPEFTWNIISPRDANERCRDIFGAGDEKTIDKDWKRYFNVNFVEEQQTNIRGTGDETIYGAASLTLNVISRKINNIKLTANRPNPSTNSKDIQDYLERWDK